MKIDVGQLIKKARQEKGYTQEELAELVGVKKSAVAKWETGRVSEIKRSNLKKISEALSIDAPMLLGEDPSVAEKKPTTMQDDGLREDVKQFAAFLESCSEEETKALLAMSQAFLANLRAGSFVHPEEDSKKTR